MKKTVCLFLTLLALMMLFTGCGEDTKPTNDPAQDSVATTDNEGKDNDSKVDLIYGNSPNNIFQNSKTLAFGNGRVYYIDSGLNLCSFKQDGTDYAVHGAAGDQSKMSVSVSLYQSMNFYNGSIYYFSSEPASDGSDVMVQSVRCFDLSTSQYTDIANFEDFGCNGMLIINDTAFVSTSKIRKEGGYTQVHALDLKSGNKNTLLDKKLKCTQANCGFSSDGKCLYITLNDTNGPSLYKTLLSDVFNAEVQMEYIGAIRTGSMGSIILDENAGSYVIVKEGNGNSVEYHYGFHKYSDIQKSEAYDNVISSWPFHKDFGYVKNVEFPSDENGEIGNLGFDDSVLSYMLDNHRVSIKTAAATKEFMYTWRVFYSNDELWNGSVKLSTIDNPEKKGFHGSTLYAGEFNNTVYIVDEDEKVLHNVSSDGTYQ